MAYIPRYKHKGKKTSSSKYVKATSSKEKTGMSIAKLNKEVGKLKRVINSEKKHIEFTLGGNLEEGGPVTVAQTFGIANTGWNLLDVTPSNIPQGVKVNERTGDSVKLASLRMRWNFVQMKQLQTRMRIKLVLLKVKGSPLDVSGGTGSSTTQSVMARIFEPNPITGYTDYLSDRNPDFFNEFKVITTKKVTIPIDAFSSQNAPNQADLVCTLRLNHHIRWDQYSEDLANGQYLLAMLADTGNSSQLTAGPSVPGISNPQISSGANGVGYFQYYYYDN